MSVKIIDVVCPYCRFKQRIELDNKLFDYGVATVQCVRCEKNFETVCKRPKKETDNINHPNHYNQGKYECIDVMLDVFGEEAVKNFCACNVFKYIWRYRAKNGAEDVEKALFYLKKWVELNGGTVK